MVVRADAPVRIELDAVECELFRELRRLRQHGYGRVVVQVQQGRITSWEYAETHKPASSNGAG